ncbi:MAG: ABC transporter substrate-binding protein [Patescibacteria group bacterium]|nr:ABC transporter substrate-binding protein [Patescibacteria group bacterium]
MFSFLKKTGQIITKNLKRNKNVNRLEKDDILLMKKMRKNSFLSLRQFFSINKVLSGSEKLIFFLAVIIFVVSFVWGANVLLNKYGVVVANIGGDYIEGTLGAPQLINPLFASLNDVDQDLVNLIYTGLMRYDKDRNLITDLASSYEVSEDKKEYTFKLRQGVFWQDGEKFKADDVMFTFDTIQDSLVGSPLKVSFDNVKLEKIDDNTIKFTLNDAFPSFLSTLTVGILPQHIWSSVSPDKMKLAGRNLQPVGTGPFKFSKLIKNSNGTINKVTLERFSDFYRQPAYLKTFSFIFYNDYDGPDGVITALREQKVEGISFVPFEYREKVTRKHIDLHTLKLPQYTALFYNMDRKVLEEQEVRLALSEAMDRDRIVSDVLDNEAQLINGPILEGFPGFDANLAGPTFSVEDANKLLDKHFERISAEDYRNLLIDAQLKILEEQAKKEMPTSTDDNITSSTDSNVASTSSDINLDELRKQAENLVDNSLDEVQSFYRYADKNDKTKIVELNLVTSANPEYNKVAQLIAGYLQDVGIRVNVRLVDANDFVRQVLKTHDYDILLYGVIVGNDPDQYPFWNSNQIVYPGLNFSHYIKRGVDDLLDKIRSTKDENELSAGYSELQKTILADVPANFLYVPTYSYALTDTIKGFDVERIAHPSDRLVNITDWYIKTKKVWKFKK